jgi:short-subunit dehydrogenase
MKHIVIMGATSGIGLRVAEIYATAGWRVGVAGRKDDVMKELQKRFPKRIEWEHIDVTHKDSVMRLERLIKNLGGMDIYLHVSGIGYESTGLNTSEEVATAETNVVGFTRMIDTAFRYFRDKCAGVGHIAAITSIAGTKGIGELASYSSSKKYQQTYLTALEQLANMEGMQISFTDIRPGWIRTPLLKADREYPMTMELEEIMPAIIKALIRKSRVVVIDCRWRAAYYLWRLIPDCFWVKMPLRVSTSANKEEIAENTVVEEAEETPA